MTGPMTDRAAGAYLGILTQAGRSARSGAKGSIRPRVRWMPPGQGRFQHLPRYRYHSRPRPRLQIHRRPRRLRPHQRRHRPLPRQRLRRHRRPQQKAVRSP
jgi:hypothetical protein